jgi:hypothetical protein
MKTQTWIPNKNEVVLWNSAPWKVLSVNMGGKCTLKQIPLSRKIGRVVKDVDLSELSQRS